MLPDFSLKTINVGYTLPKRWTSKICIESLRVFFAADNLYFTSAHTGFDPRTASSQDRTHSGSRRRRPLLSVLR